MKHAVKLVYPHYTKKGQIRECRIDLLEQDGKYYFITLDDSNKVKYFNEISKDLKVKFLKQDKIIEGNVEILGKTNQAIEVAKTLKTPFFTPKKKRILIEFKPN